MFYPVAIETAGTWHELAIELIERDRQAHHHSDIEKQHSCSNAVHGSPEREFSLLSKHNVHQMKRRCNHLHFFYLTIFMPAALLLVITSEELPFELCLVTASATYATDYLSPSSCILCYCLHLPLAVSEAYCPHFFLQIISRCSLSPVSTSRVDGPS